jgi:hypothetical protein
MTEEPENLEKVQQRLKEIQIRKRGRVRWNISRHTAEMALDAILPPVREEEARRSAKSRRRKRKKRLL